MQLKDMNIFIITNSDEAYLIFKMMFLMYKNVTVVNSDFLAFMDKYENVECIVSPANSYGYMNGGFDAAISDYFGWNFQEKVQQYIKDNYYGEQLVGSSFIIDAPKNKKLIHTPTMIEPSIIKDETVVYTAMRSTLICALNNDIKSIVIPTFGTGTGEVSYQVAANLMRKGLHQILVAQNKN